MGTRELDIWVNRLGVPPMEALRAATYWPAVALRAERDYGTISEGKYADVDLVIKHGTRVK